MTTVCEFHVVYPDEPAGTYGSKEDPAPYIHLADPSRDIENLLDADEIVIDKKEFIWFIQSFCFV